MRGVRTQACPCRHAPLGLAVVLASLSLPRSPRRLSDAVDELLLLGGAADPSEPNASSATITSAESAGVPTPESTAMGIAGPGLPTPAAAAVGGGGGRGGVWGGFGRRRGGAGGEDACSCAGVVGPAVGRPAPFGGGRARVKSSVLSTWPSVAPSLCMPLAQRTFENVRCRYRAFRHFDMLKLLPLPFGWSPGRGHQPRGSAK